MFCEKCGAKVIEGSVFCEKCGAKLMGGGEEKAEITGPDKLTIPEVQKITEWDRQAASETPNSIELVSPGKIYDLLWENIFRCPKIKKIDFQQKTGITMLKGERNRYFVGFSWGDYRLSVCSKLLFSIHRIIFWFVIVITVSLLVEEGDLEEIYPLLGWCLLIGGVGGIVSETICRREKKEVTTFIKEVLSKNVRIKGPVMPIIEPLLSYQRLWFLGFSLPIASVIESIVCFLAALAGGMVLIVGSGVLDNIGTPGYNESSYDAYNDKPEADHYMPSSDVENISLGKVYTNEEEGFSFMYPDDWEIENIEDVDPEALVSVACTGMYGTYARIVVGKEIDDGFCFAATKSDFEAVYSSTEGIGNLKLMDLSDIELSGCSARKLVVAGNNDIGARLIWTQYFYIRDSYVYSVICVAEEDNYNSYEPKFNAIMDSYTITAANEAALPLDDSEIVDMYEGSWSGRDYDNLYMEISYMDENGGYFVISISWRGGESEWIQWELWGAYIEEDGGIQYGYGSEIEYMGSYETGEIEGEVVSEAEEGFLQIGDDGVLYWYDHTDPTEEWYALEKLTY